MKRGHVVKLFVWFFQRFIVAFLYICKLTNSQFFLMLPVHIREYILTVKQKRTNATLKNNKRIISPHDHFSVSLTHITLII